MVATPTDRKSRARTVNVECTTEDQEETLYTCPTNCRAYMSLLYTSNTSGGTCTVDIEFNRADTSHMHILGSKNMSNGEFIQWSGGFIVLEPTETITVTPSSQAAPHIDVMATVEEFFTFEGQ